MHGTADVSSRAPAAKCCCAAPTASAPSRLPRCSPRNGRWHRRRRNRPPRPAASSRPRRRRHLPLHGRRPVAGRYVRSTSRCSSSDHGQDPHRDLQGRADAVQQRRPRDGVAVEVPPARPERPLGQRPVPARRRVRRRPARRPLDDVEVLRAHQRQLFPAHRHGIQGRPSMGAWVSYGLGSENRRPARLHRPQRRPDSARRARQLQQRLSARPPIRARSSAPAIRPSPTSRRSNRTPTLQTRQARPAAPARSRHARAHRHTPTQIESAIANYETAFRMQTAVPELMDLTGEIATPRKKLYGLDATYAPTRSIFGRAMPDRPPPGRARRPLHRTDLPERRRRPLGPARQPEEGPREQRPRRRSADRRPAART